MIVYRILDLSTKKHWSNPKGKTLWLRASDAKRALDTRGLDTTNFSIRSYKLKFVEVVYIKESN